MCKHTLTIHNNIPITSKFLKFSPVRGDVVKLAPTSVQVTLEVKVAPVYYSLLEMIDRCENATLTSTNINT